MPGAGTESSSASFIINAPVEVCVAIHRGSVFDPTFAGDANPADNIACVTFVDGFSTGIAEDLAQISDKIYVANNQLIINIDNASFNEPATVNIVNLAGQVMQTEQLSFQQGVNRLDLNTSFKGMYVVSINVDGGNYF